MQRTRNRVCGVVGVVLIGMIMAGCNLNAGVGPGGAFVEFTLGGKRFTFTFFDVGVIDVRANQASVVPSGFRLFENTPTETPPSATMTLPSSSVGVGRRLTSKAIARSQALPLNGSATIEFTIASGQSASLCGAAVFLSRYEMTFTSGQVAILNEDFPLSAQAISIVVTNEVTICITITSDFDAEITIGDFDITFGDDSGPPDTDEPTVTPGAFIQVPIANRQGDAVVAPVNRMVNGVDYGVVGVLEAATPDAPDPVSTPDLISIDLEDLGLASVTRLYMATHSSFVPDVPNGIELATLTVTYAEGGSPTTLDFVVGATTSEWSYDRPDHVSNFGGVQHALAPVLYSFSTTIGSAFEYTGYSYSVTLPLDSSRTPSCLSLTMADPSTYASLRPSTSPEPTWADQAIMAITLEGPAGSPGFVIGLGCLDVILAECRSNIDCSTGEVCRDGECTAVVPECTTVSDCLPGEVCMGGECTPETPECTFESDCLPGEMCVDGECTPDTPECITSNDCLTGEICENGECVPDTVADCTTSLDCLLGEECVAGECVPETDCSADGNCNGACSTDNPDPDCEEACVLDGFCNENCSDLTPDPDCDVAQTGVPRCTVRSTFDGGDEGWLILGDAEGGRGEPDFVASGGNPGGHASADDDVQGGIWFFQAPAKYHGNFSAALGRTLTFDLKQSTLSSQFDGNDVVLIGGGLTIVVDAGSNPGLDWTPYSVALDTSAGWKVGTLSGADATQAQILTVLGDLSDFQLRGEYVSGPDTGGLDNVVLNSGCN